MQTVKATLKELKELVEFKAVNKKGETATFKVNGDSALVTFEDGTEKEMKLDSIRRSWLLVVNEEENKNEEEIEMAEVKVGNIVKDVRTEEVGEVTGIQGRLVTIENKKGDFPADIDNVEVIEAIEKPEEVEQPKEEKPNNVVELKPAEKPENKKEEKPAKQSAPKDDEEFKTPAEIAFQIVDQSGVEFKGGEGVQLLNYEVAMGRKHEKSITDISISDHLMRIKQNGAYIMDVNLYDVNGQHVYKAKNMSIKDALEFLGFDGEHMKQARKAITNLRKLARGTERFDNLEKAQE